MAGWSEKVLDIDLNTQSDKVYPLDMEMAALYRWAWFGCALAVGHGRSGDRSTLDGSRSLSDGLLCQADQRAVHYNIAR